jgi:hypothetical protein
MTKHQQFFKTKIHFVLIVLLFLGNFFNFTLSLSYFSEESLDLEQNSQDEFNFYKGVNCTKLGEYDSNYGTPYEMLIAEHSSRTLAFIRENYGILVVDISDPEQPFFVNQYFERERIEALFVSNDYLFIVNSSDDLLIYNIQDLSNPLLTFAGFLDSTYYFTSLFVQDDILYAGVGYSGLVMYNISIPWDPQFVSEYQHESYLDRFDDIVVCDNNLYLCHENVFQIVDLTDIQNPNLTGIFLADRTYTDFRDIFILDDKAYLCADDGCFFILDIADLTNPTQITAIWDESQYFSDFYTDGSTGYLLSYYGGLALLDLTNLPYIEYVNKENSKVEYCSLGFHVGHPILLDSQEGIEIYEVNEDYSTELLSRFWDGGYAVNVVVNENHAFVANSYNGLEIYKIRNTLAPEFRSRTLVGSRCSNVYVNKNLAYVIDHDYDELYTIDISNKRNPKILSYQNLQIEINNSTYYPSNFEIIGDQALVNYYGSTRTLVILDLSNSSDFQVIDLIPINAYVNDLHYDFPYIYLQVNHEYFSIYFNDGSEWILLSNTYIVHQLQY